MNDPTYFSSSSTPSSPRTRVNCSTTPLLHDLLDAHVPSSQVAVITPEVGACLNLRPSIIAVQQPRLGEALDACFSLGPEPGFPGYNHIAGHEGIGHVVKCHDPSLLGRAVAIRYLAYSCQSCTYCLRGLYTSCQSQLNAPKSITGTFQQYACVPLNCLMPLPDGLLCSADPKGNARYTAALCSGSTALRALRNAQTRPGDVVAIVGVLGAIGHLAGAIAKHVFGARVIGIDLKRKIDKLPVESEHFGDIFIAAPQEGDPRQLGIFCRDLRDACSKLRVNTETARLADSLIACGSTGSSFSNLDEYVCDGGSIVCVGVPRGLGSLDIQLINLVERSLRVCGNLMGGRQEALEVMQYIKSGQCRPIITEVSLNEVPENMQRLIDCDTVGKVVVRVDQIDGGGREAIKPAEVVA